MSDTRYENLMSGGWSFRTGGSSSGSSSGGTGLTAEQLNQLNSAVKRSEYAVEDANEHVTTGYAKTGKNFTTNLPSEVYESDSEWGVLFFIAENTEELTGTQVYYPIDGPYKGRMFTRSLTCMASDEPRIGDWYLITVEDDLDDIREQISSINESLNGVETLIGSGVIDSGN